MITISPRTAPRLHGQQRRASSTFPSAATRCNATMRRPSASRSTPRTNWRTPARRRSPCFELTWLPSRPRPFLRRTGHGALLGSTALGNGSTRRSARLASSRGGSATSSPACRLPARSGDEDQGSSRRLAAPICELGLPPPTPAAVGRPARLRPEAVPQRLPTADTAPTAFPTRPNAGRVKRRCLGLGPLRELEEFLREERDEPRIGALRVRTRSATSGTRSEGCLFPLTTPSAALLQSRRR